MFESLVCWNFGDLDEMGCHFVCWDWWSGGLRALGSTETAEKSLLGGCCRPRFCHHTWLYCVSLACVAACYRFCFRVQSTYNSNIFFFWKQQGSGLLLLQLDVSVQNCRRARVHSGRTGVNWYSSSRTPVWTAAVEYLAVLRTNQALTESTSRRVA